MFGNNFIRRQEVQSLVAILAALLSLSAVTRWIKKTYYYRYVGCLLRRCFAYLPTFRTADT